VIACFGAQRIARVTDECTSPEDRGTFQNPKSQILNPNHFPLNAKW